MDWPVLVAVIAVALGVPYALFVVPLGRTVLRAVRIARDPLHRSTPESSWEVFDRVVWFRLVPVWLAWAVMLLAACLVGPMMFAFLGPLADAHPRIFFYALLYPAHLAGSWSMAFAALIFWAPRSGPAGLLARVTGTVIAIQALVGLAVMGLSVGAGRPGLPGSEAATAFAIATLVVGLTAAAISWTRARRLGDAWFEFDEERIERAAERIRR
jgi:hypothetical protein